MSIEFGELAHELDREAYEWLAKNHPLIADAVQRLVEQRATPDQVRSFVLRHRGATRGDFARTCESAARFLLDVAE